VCNTTVTQQPHSQSCRNFHLLILQTQTQKELFRKMVIKQKQFFTSISVSVSRVKQMRTHIMSSLTLMWTVTWLGVTPHLTNVYLHLCMLCAQWPPNWRVGSSARVKLITISKVNFIKLLCSYLCFVIYKSTQQHSGSNVYFFKFCYELSVPQYQITLSWVFRFKWCRMTVHMGKLLYFPAKVKWGWLNTGRQDILIIQHSAMENVFWNKSHLFQFIFSTPT